MFAVSKSPKILRKSLEKKTHRQLSIDLSPYKHPITHDLIKATNTTVNFKINKRRKLKMLQRIVSPHEDRKNQSDRNIVSSDEESHSKEEILSTSKYRKVSIILNNDNGINITNTTENFNQPSPLKRKRIFDAELESEEGTLSTPLYKRVSIIINGTDSNDIDANDVTGTHTRHFVDDKLKVAMIRNRISTSIPSPDGWESLYSLVEELRQDKSAPVDATVVCAEELAERHRGDVVYRFQVLISVMLNSNSNDAVVVGKTIKKLQKHGLDVNNIEETSIKELNQLIHKVGFHNNKANFINRTVGILIRDYEADIPCTAREMQKLSGVGRKMSYILEYLAFERCTGIAIDIQMHQIFNQMGLVQNTKTPEQTRIQLESWLPIDQWPAFNLLFVGFCQEVHQQKQKLLKKALNCSRPEEALDLLRVLGYDIESLCFKWNFELA